jgi:hypothetical protein
MGAPEQEASDSACDRSRPLPSTDCAPQASPSHHHHLLLLQACEAYQALLAQGLVRTADGPRAGSAAAVPPQPSVDVRARRSPVPIGRHLASPQCPCPPRLRPRSPPPCRRRRWLCWRRSDERQAPLGSHARGSYAKHLARTSASKHASQSACLPRSLLACICIHTHDAGVLACCMQLEWLHGRSHRSVHACFGVVWFTYSTSPVSAEPCCPSKSLERQVCTDEYTHLQHIHTHMHKLSKGEEASIYTLVAKGSGCHVQWRAVQ